MPTLPASLIVTACLALVPFRTLPAQPDPYTVEELAPGAFAVVRQVPTKGFSDANVLFFVNEHDVIVVDANIYPASTRQVIREIKARTDKPIRVVINTHFHSDHHYGNDEYRKAFPAVEFVQHAETRKAIIEQDMPSLPHNINVEYPAIVARYEQAISTGKREDGTTIDEPAKARMRELVRLYRFVIQDAKGLTMVPATITVTDSLVLHRGERTIVVKWLGKGNTPGDVVVHLPKEGIVATGDLVVSPFPFGFGSFVSSWPDVLRRVKGLAARVIVPGHGNLMRDTGYIDRLIPMLEWVHAEVQRAVAAGADLEATRKSLDWSRWIAEFGGNDDGVRRGFQNNFIVPIVEGAYKEAKAAAEGAAAPATTTAPRS